MLGVETQHINGKLSKWRKISNLNTKEVFIINFDEINLNSITIKKSSKADLYCLYFDCGRGRHTSYKLLLKSRKMHHLPLKNHVKLKHDNGNRNREECLHILST